MPSQATRGIQFREPPVFELGAPGRSGVSLPALDVPAVEPSEVFGAFARKTPAGLPEVSEPEAFRHFVRLSQWNFSAATNFYPLAFDPHNSNTIYARLDGTDGLFKSTNAGATWRANGPSNIPPEVDAAFKTFVKELSLNLGKGLTDGTTPLSKAYYTFWKAHNKQLRQSGA